MTAVLGVHRVSTSLYFDLFVRLRQSVCLLPGLWLIRGYLISFVFVFDI